MMWAVTWFSVTPGRRNLMVSQCAASPMAPTMRRHSCSSTFLTARASIIGVMPSTQSMFASLKAAIMLMSMKSTPSFIPATPLFFICSRAALVNLPTCCREAGTGRALDPGVRPLDVFLGNPRRMALDLEPEVALLEQHRRIVAAEHGVAQPGLEAVPARRQRAGQIPHVLVVHADHGAEAVRLHALARALQPVLPHAIPVDALLPVESRDSEVCSHCSLCLVWVRGNRRTLREKHYVEAVLESRAYTSAVGSQRSAVIPRGVREMRTSVVFVMGILLGLAIAPGSAQDQKLPGDNYVNHIGFAVRQLRRGVHLLHAEDGLPRGVHREGRRRESRSSRTSRSTATRSWKSSRRTRTGDRGSTTSACTCRISKASSRRSRHAA